MPKLKIYQILSKICIVIGICAASVFLTAGMVSANTVDPKVAQVCSQSAQIASRESGVPFDVLMAIAKTETGRQINGATQPWPWAINTRGTGQWLPNRAALLDAALSNIASDETSFDVGCFQINYRWHSQNFASLDEMIDPLSNARYAARFLRELQLEFGTWREAAGAYHSRTAEHADRYKQQFSKNLTTVDDAPTPPQSYVRKVNNFPLLKDSDGALSNGSLVPSRGPASQSSLGGLVN